jgi:hypothetical protein
MLPKEICVDLPFLTDRFDQIFGFERCQFIKKEYPPSYAIS